MLSDYGNYLLKTLSTYVIIDKICKDSREDRVIGDVTGETERRRTFYKS